MRGLLSDLSNYAGPAD